MGGVTTGPRFLQAEIALLVEGGSRLYEDPVPNPVARFKRMVEIVPGCARHHGSPLGGCCPCRPVPRVLGEQVPVPAVPPLARPLRRWHRRPAPLIVQQGRQASLGSLFPSLRQVFEESQQFIGSSCETAFSMATIICMSNCTTQTAASASTANREPLTLHPKTALNPKPHRSLIEPFQRNPI